MSVRLARRLGVFLLNLNSSFQLHQRCSVVPLLSVVACQIAVGHGEPDVVVFAELQTPVQEAKGFSILLFFE